MYRMSIVCLSYVYRIYQYVQYVVDVVVSWMS